MLMMTSPWFWGFCGAFIYAATRFSTCLLRSFQTGERWWLCAVDAGIAVLVGPVAAGAFTVTIQKLSGLSGVEHVPAVAATIGLLANPLAPGLTDVLAKGALRRAEKMAGGEK